MNTILKKTNILAATVLIAVAGMFSSCEKNDTFIYNDNVAAAKPATVFIGLTNSVAASATAPLIPSQLIRYNASVQQQITALPLPITGLQTNETIIAIDYRPKTKILYGFSNQSRIYTLALGTAVVTPTLVGQITPAVTGSIAAFDFNPVADRLRIITSAGQNYRVDVTTTPITVINDGAINGVANAVITGCAYTNNVDGATATTLYDLDVASGKLFRQDANAGTLTEVGNLGSLALPFTSTTNSTAYNTNITTARTTAPGGFDISATNVGLAVFNNNASPAIPVGGITAAGTGILANPTSAVAAQAGTSTLFQVNLETGRLTDLGVLPIPAAVNYGPGTQIIGLAIVL